MSVPVCQRITQQRTTQQGQAMVFVLLTLGVVLLSLTFLYKAGRLTSEKMMLQNAADAGAYSISLLEARDLNFSSYLNRAKVANEIGVAQFVGLYSWATQYSSTASHFKALGTYVSAIPIVGAALKSGLSTIGTTIGKAGDAITKVMDRVAPLAFRFLNGVNLAYSVATGGFHIATMYLIVSSLFDPFKSGENILGANNKDAKLSDAGILSTAVHLFTYQTQFAKTYNPAKPADDFSTFAALTSDSRDRFSKARSWTLRPFDELASLGVPKPKVDVELTVDIPVFGEFTIFEAHAEFAIQLTRAGGTELRFKRKTGTGSNVKVSGQYASWSAADVTQLGLELSAYIKSDLYPLSGGFKAIDNEISLKFCVNVLVTDICGGPGETIDLPKIPFPTTVPLTTGGAQAANTSPSSKLTYRPLARDGELVPQGYGFPGPSGRVPGPAYGGASGSNSLAQNWMGTSAGLPFGGGIGYQAVSQNPLEQSVAANASRSASKITGYKGLPGYTDTVTTFKNGKLAKPDQYHVFFAPYILIGVVMDKVDSDDNDIGDGIQPTGRQRLITAAADRELGAIAKAEVYFIRPTTGLSYFHRTDGYAEYDSAFNPYWQAHLVDTTGIDRYLMLLLQQKTFWINGVNSAIQPFIQGIDNLFGGLL